MGLLATLGLPPLNKKAPDGPDLASLLNAAGDQADPGVTTTAAAGSGGGTGGATPATGGTPPVPTSGPSAGSGAPPAAGAADKDAKAYAVARAALKRELDALNKHPQQGRIGSEIAAAAARLAAADGFAAAKDWPHAMQALNDTKALAATAKKAGDDWVAYLRQRADAEALAFAFGSAAFDAGAWVQPKLVAADNLAKGPPLNFPAALAAIAAIPTQLKPLLAKTIADVKAKVALIDATSKEARAFAKAQVDPGRQHLAAAEKHFAAGEWSACLQRAAAALRLLGPAARICQRRERYDSQRAKTVAALALVRAQLPLKARADTLDQQRAESDTLAGIGTLKIEDGLALLVRVEQQATLWAGIGPTLAEHTRERAAADRELAELDKHPAAAHITAQREAIRTRLAGAKNLTVVVDGAPDPAAGWANVLAEVKRARADLAAARAVVDGLGAVAAAEGAAAKPGNKMALKAALDQLTADGQAAASAQHAAASAQHAGAAKDAFQRFDAAVKASRDALAGNDGDKAAAALKQAAAALAEAKAIQAAHAQFADGLPALEAALKALQASPRAAVIQPHIEPVERALADARAADAKHDGVAAIAALRHGMDQVAEAQAADQARAAYDQRVAEIGPRIAALADAGEKNALNTLAGQAKAKADALDFAAAGKLQDQIEMRLDKSALKGLMGAGAPDAAKITELAKKMVGHGGAAEVDQMIQGIPNGGDIKLLNALAEGRYGVKFTNQAPFPAKPAVGTSPAVPAGDPVKTMKVVCGMFAQIPQDIVGSPSVAGVEWSDAVGSAGGSHSYDDVKIRMNGRPGIPQQFGAAQKNWDKKTGSFVPELPGDVEPDCQPKNAAAVEYLGFAAAHEVGHAVDDARGFMARNGHLEKYGGWTTYGASVQPIADAIGGDARFAAFYKTTEQKRYIADRLLNKPVQPPAAKPGDETTALAAFHTWLAIATANDVYRRQGDCDAIKIGEYVYHEAYARVWVRYHAAARKKALTGYQFRAPGEWFAELYAGYRSNKLKDTHPAMEWLKKL